MTRESYTAAAWLRQLHYIISELEIGRKESAWIKEFSEDMGKSLLTGLLYAHKNNYTETLEGYISNPAPFYIKMAERYIQENAATNIKMADIVAASNISERALYAGFRRFRGTTPMLYLQKIRLENIHKDMLSANPSDTVTSIASSWGITQFGRFSNHFKKAYGVTPSQFLEKARRLKLS